MLSSRPAERRQGGSIFCLKEVSTGKPTNVEKISALPKKEADILEKGTKNLAKDWQSCF